MYRIWRVKKMKMSATVSVVLFSRRSLLLLAICLLFAGSSVYAEPNLYNNEDFAGLAEEWYQSCSSGNGWCNGYDYDISGTVDIKDLNRFANLWLTSKDPTPYSDAIAKWTVEQAVIGTDKWNYDRGFILLSLYEKWLGYPNPTHLAFIKNWVDAIVRADGPIR